MSEMNEQVVRPVTPSFAAWLRRCREVVVEMYRHRRMVLVGRLALLLAPAALLLAVSLLPASYFLLIGMGLAISYPSFEIMHWLGTSLTIKVVWDPKATALWMLVVQTALRFAVLGILYLTLLVVYTGVLRNTFFQGDANMPKIANVMILVCVLLGMVSGIAVSLHQFSTALSRRKPEVQGRAESAD